MSQPPLTDAERACKREVARLEAVVRSRTVKLERSERALREAKQRLHGFGKRPATQPSTEAA